MKNLFFRKEIIRVLLTIFIGLPALVYGYGGGSNSMTQTMQEKVVHGSVVGNDGAPLPGVNVTIRGTMRGVISDSDGNYSLAVPGNNAVLSFSFIGFKTQDISVGSGNVIDVVLQEELKKIDEVIVVGYGTQRKQDLTGSISRVTGENMIQASTSTFDQMLQGKVPGVQITQTSGAPGGNVNILIRGVSSITGGNQPLYVIDGFPINVSEGNTNMLNFGSSLYTPSSMSNNAQSYSRINPLSSINPSDIESIEILKDASATAIYGSRGANGVVIITTKRGSAGKAQINVDVSYGVQEITHKLDMLDAQEYIDYVVEARNNAWINSGAGRLATDPNSVRTQSTRIPEGFDNPSSITTNTDWQDVIYRSAPVRNYQVSANGGNEKIKYLVSGGYFDQQGIVLATDYKRFNLRSNIDAQVLGKLKVGSTISGSYGYGNFVNTESHYGVGNVVAIVLTASPTIRVHDDNGNPYFNGNDVSDGLGWLVNPLTVLNRNNYSDNRNQANLMFNNFLDYEILEGFTFRSSIGINYNQGTTKLWRSSALPYSTSLNYPSTGAVSKSDNIDWLNENTLNFKRVLNEKHFFDALLGFTAQKSTSNQLSAGATSFPTDYVPYITAGTVNAGSHYKSEWSMLSLISRLNYSYEGKYLFTATIRRDASSRFGANNRWGTFPSFSVGYNIAEESFMKALDFISNLKLRVSYGVAGNNQIGNYSTIGLLSASNYVNGTKVLPGLGPSSLSNDDLTWEKSLQTDFGLDLGLFKDRISLIADIYKNKKTDLLLAVQLPGMSGYSSSTQNIGDIENKGIEFGLQTINIKSGGFNWSSDLTFSANKNKVLKLASVGARITNNTFQVTEVGSPMSSFYLVNAIGVFQNAEEIAGSALVTSKTQPGDLKFEDFNGDKTITAADKKIVGNPWPDFTWGFNNRFSYKNLSLAVTLNGSNGAYNLYQAGPAAGVMNCAGVQNQIAEFGLNRWRSESEPGDGRTPRAIRDNYAWAFSDITTHFLFDASYVRIKNINLSYSLPRKIIRRLSLSDLTVYGDIANVFTFTDYPGYDPESSSTGNSITNSGIDYLTFPLARTYTIGIKLAF